MRIIGIDPGSRRTGYGCIEVHGNELRHIAHDTLDLDKNLPLEKRLQILWERLSAVMRTHSPQIMVIEKIFFAKNAISALKLGQARGVALLCGATHAVEVVEYNPTEVKLALTGNGRAEKEQVAKMVELLVGKLHFSTWDASDALALAICHAHHMRNSWRTKVAPERSVCTN